MAVPDTTPVTVVLPVNPTPIAVRRRFPVTTDVPQPTPAVSAPLVRATRIVTCPINLVTADVLPQTPVANVLPASPARLRILVPAFPAALTPTAPVALVTATPDIRAMQIPDVLKWIPVLTQRRHPAVQASVKTLGLLLVPKTEQPITTGAVRPSVLPDRPASTELV